MHAPRPAEDAARVAALAAYGVAGTSVPVPELAALTRLASVLCGGGKAVVNLLDASSQWQPAATGVEPGGRCDREDSMCDHVVSEARTIAVRDASADPRFADNPWVDGRLASVRSYAAAPLVAPSGHVVGTLCVFDEEPRSLTEEQLGALADLAAQAVVQLELRRTGEALAAELELAHRQARTDPLTGLLNRRGLREAVAPDLDGVRRGGDVVLAVVDLDGFKGVNDAHGLAAGDAVLVEVARRLCREVRAADVVARVGGDEFVVVLRGASREDAELVLPRLREAVCQPVRLPRGGTAVVGASVGVVVCADGVVDDLHLLEADRLMYREKAARVS